jgi:putative nucleotidyltransferase with HDIG domain
MVGIPLMYSQKYVDENRTSDALMGVLYVDSKAKRRRFNEEDLSLLLALSYQAAICIENAQIHHDLRENYVALVTSLAQAVELKDRYTRGHSELVSRYAVAIAERLSLTGREIEDVARGALLHDVGKIGIDESILNKCGKLTAEEAELIRQHPRFGAQILQPIPYMIDVRDTVLHHHERLDGNGYPDGLKGDEIKLGARIVAIADVFEALTARRSYRRALSARGVIKHLETEAESRLDPELVSLFIDIFKEAEFKKGAIRPKSVVSISFNARNVRKETTLKTGTD